MQAPPANGLPDFDCTCTESLKHKIFGVQAMSADRSLSAVSRQAAVAELARLRVAYVRALLKCSR